MPNPDDSIRGPKRFLLHRRLVDNRKRAPARAQQFGEPVARGTHEPGLGTEPQALAPLVGIWADAFPDARPTTIGEIVDRVADRGFGLLLVTLSLPTLIPVLPPGTATVIGLAYVVLGIQMLRGAVRPWVPKRVRSVRLSGSATAALRAVGVGTLSRMAHATRPRVWYLPDEVYMRGAGFVVVLLGLLLLTPIPFLHTMPAIAVILLGLGLFNHDGLLVIAGLLVATGVALAAVIGAGALYAFVRYLLSLASRAP